MPLLNKYDILGIFKFRLKFRVCCVELSANSDAMKSEALCSAVIVVSIVIKALAAVFSCFFIFNRQGIFLVR